MKKPTLLLMVIVSILMPINLMAKSVVVKGHFSKSGSYVMPQKRTYPDNSKFNNWSTKGNYNPYTGKIGNINPYKPYKKKVAK